MTYYGDKETYVPKFKVGDTVYHDRNYDLVRTITGRKITRQASRCDTYYQLDARYPTGAWESSLQPVSELMEPGAVLARILPMFDAPVYVLTVDATSFALVLNVSETRRVKLFADLDGGQVQTLGEWRWQVLIGSDTPSIRAGSAPNLGGALVDASNTLHGYKETDPIH